MAHGAAGGKQFFARIPSASALAFPRCKRFVFQRMKSLLSLLPLALALLATVAAPAAETGGRSVVTDGNVYELRTYIASPGKLEQLHARFRDHTCKLLPKHGMKLLGFWVPQEAAKGADNTLIYIVQHKNREAADASWKAFRADPEWVAAKAESEKGGSLTTRVDSVFMNPTDYSAMK